MMRNSNGKMRMAVVASLALIATSNATAADVDIGKKACAKEARILCPKEMKSLSRKKVEACMVKNVDKVSPACKAAMYEIKRRREAKRTG